MKKLILVFGCLMSMIFTIVSCSKNNSSQPLDSFAATKTAFGTAIDMNNLANYANQIIPSYITKDNTGGNTISDSKATIGRVLFYDKSLSVNNTVACANCHQQKFAFSDTALVSSGVSGGITARHSIRLINSRFAAENKFFWDERAISLEA